MTPAPVFADLELARRLEDAEGHASARYVEARQRLFPDRGYEWRSFGSTRAMYDGADSPITQTFGLGMDDSPAAETMEAIESFFRSREVPVFHEVSPLADAATLALLPARGYTPIEYTSVMYRPLDAHDAGESPSPRLEVRPIRPDEGELWAEVTVRGWSHLPELTDYLHALAPVTTTREDSVSLLAFLDGEPVASAALSLHGGILLLGGACTVPEARRRGAQGALLDYRIRHAVGEGCDLAMMCAAPGSASQRNAERQGFRIAYTRIKWQA